jgi:peptidoglycan/xylan/chitin deacetylase (PgdA/CDA1 family)
MGKKDILARVLCWGKLENRIRAIRDRLDRTLLILTYHRVIDMPEGDQYNFDPELISASESDFRWQMEYVKKHYEVIGFEKLDWKLDGSSQKSKPPMIVTFDDGYQDNFHAAKTILAEKKMNAVFFVSSGYVGNREMFWFDRVYHYFMVTRDEKIDIAGRRFFISGQRCARSAQALIVINHLKKVSNYIRLQALEIVDQKLLGRLSDKVIDTQRAMTWDQLRQLVSIGMEIGSHSVTHPILTRLTDEDLQLELVDSKYRLQEETGKPVIAISYPNGGIADFDKRILQASIRAGYQFGCSYIPGGNRVRSLEKSQLRRLHVEKDTSRARFKAMLAWPELMS